MPQVAIGLSISKVFASCLSEADGHQRLARLIRSFQVIIQVIPLEVNMGISMRSLVAGAASVMLAVSCLGCSESSTEESAPIEEAPIEQTAEDES